MNPTVYFVEGNTVWSFCLFRDLKQFYSSFEGTTGLFLEYKSKIPFITPPVNKNPIKTTPINFNSRLQTWRTASLVHLK